MRSLIRRYPTNDDFQKVAKAVRAIYLEVVTIFTMKKKNIHQEDRLYNESHRASQHFHVFLFAFFLSWPLAVIVSILIQSWALSLFLNFFNNKK